MDELQQLVQQHLDNYFPYLTSYGFKDLREEETYFICPWYFYDNGIVQLYIQCQGEASLLHLCIDKYDFRLVEPKNSKLTAIENQFNKLYPIVFNNSRKSETEKENTLKQLEIDWLIEMSAVLLRHSNVFNGNLDLLKKNWEQKHKNDKYKEEKERIKKGMFSLELYQFPEDKIDPFFDEKCPFNCVLEFSNLNEVQNYLEKHQEIKIYRILDCNLNEIKISNHN